MIPQLINMPAPSFALGVKEASTPTGVTAAFIGLACKTIPLRVAHSTNLPANAEERAVQVMTCSSMECPRTRAQLPPDAVGSVPQETLRRGSTWLKRLRPSVVALGAFPSTQEGTGDEFAESASAVRSSPGGPSSERGHECQKAIEFYASQWPLRFTAAWSRHTQ